jgi:hypothetical protein
LWICWVFQRVRDFYVNVNSHVYYAPRRTLHTLPLSIIFLTQNM